MSHAKAYSFLSSTPKLPSKIILVPNCDHMNNLIFGNVRRKMDTSCLRPKQLAPPSDDFQLDGIICLVVKKISHNHTTMVVAIVPLLVPTVVCHQSSGRPKSLQPLSNVDPPHGITDGTNIRNEE